MSQSPDWPPVDPYLLVNGAAIRKDIEEYSATLFVKESPVEIETAVVTEDGYKLSALECEADVCDYFETIKEDRIAISNVGTVRPSALFCLLKPAYNWSQLLITRGGILSLMASLSVFPAFFKYLSAFGLKNFPKDEGFGGYDSVITPNIDGKLREFESCYLLKHVEISQERVSGRNPWSLRHSIVYQKVSFDTHRSEHILVRLPTEAAELLGQAVTSNKNSTLEFVRNWTYIHLLCLGSVDSGWRKYINYLDEEISKVFDRVVMSGVEPTKLKEIDTTRSSSRDMKSLQYLADQALRTAHMIDINIETLDCMSQTMEKLSRLCPNSCKDFIPAFLEALQKIRRCHKFHHKNVSCLCKRIEILSKQLRDTVSLRNNELNKLNTELSNQNTIAILDLSDRASHETHVVKALTILALVFVPASFAADFLQMGYISVTQGTNFTLVASPDLQIYAALAIPLIAVTMMIYMTVEIFKQKSLKRRLPQHAHSVA